MSSSSASSVASQTQSTSPTGSDTSSYNGSGGISGYYFVFLAIAVCILGGIGYGIIRRRAKAHILNRLDFNRPTRTHHVGAQREINFTQGYAGRRRSAERSREEGLNEQGEAPPPYVPKSAEGSRSSDNTSAQSEGTVAQEEPAIPLRTLSRQSIGRPPDYEEDGAQRLANTEVNSRA